MTAATLERPAPTLKTYPPGAGYMRLEDDGTVLFVGPQYPVRRLLVTGSRDWQDRHVVASALFDYWYRADKPSDLLLVHGGARGVDQMAGEIWQKNGFQTEVHLADWDRWGKRAGILRNLQMLDQRPEHVLAFIRDESRGASQCAAEAERRGIPITYFRETS